MATAFQHPEYLAECLLLIRHQVKDAVGKHNIIAVVRQRHLLNISPDKLHVGVPQFLSVFLGLHEHLLGKINAGHMTRFASHCPCNEAVISGATAKIKYTVTGADFCIINRDPAPETQVGIRQVSLQVIIALIEGTYSFRGAARR